MNYRLARKKYKSLVISSVLHGMILLTLIYYTLLQMPQTDLANALEKPAPAPISIQTAKPRQKRVLPFQSPPAASEENTDDTLPYGEQLEQFNTLEHPYQEAVQPNEDLQESQEEFIEENMPTITQRTPEGTSPTKEPSTTDFMKAFRAAIQKERPPEAINDPQTLVQQRLGRQWGQASYSSRVAQALNNSFRINARTIRHNELVNKQVRLLVNILKDGSPGDLGNQELSGIPEVDRHIRNVVKQAHFPPIPKRFEQESYQLPIALQIVLKDGAIMFGRNYEVSER